MPEIIIKISKIDSEDFNIKVINSNYLLIKELINRERIKIIDKLKTYKIKGLIGSIKYPRNKYYQNELNELVRKKRILTKGFEQITKIF